MYKKYLTNSLIVLSLLFGFTVSAQQQNPASNLFVSFFSNDPGNVMAAIARFLIGLVGVVSLFYLILGGFQYMTAGMNSDLSKSGLKTIQHSIIGLIIVILSYIIVTVVVNSLT
jgi:hypothetical protein